MKKNIGKMLAVLAAMLLLPSTVYAESAAAAAVGESAAVSGQTIMGAGGAAIDMSSINQSAASPDEAMAIGQKLASVNGITITYQLPDGQTETLDGLTLASWVTGNQGATVTVDTEKAAAYVQGLKDKYDTKNSTQTWQSADGTTKSIKTSSYGWIIDKEKETAALVEAIQGLQSVTREPVYSSRGTQYAMPQWGTTFVEIDLSDQHAYFYQNGSCVWDSPVVTGTATDPERATPTGVFTLNYKQTDRVLKGQIDPKTKKPSYESHVDYWMPFNGGIGLHDASWRSTFGGTIYQKNGSHGCINLPAAKAKALYDLISKGTVIVVCD